MNRIWRSLAVAVGIALVSPALAADRAMIVLDASGSMWADAGGKTRIEVARETLESVLGTFPPELELGLVAYGHRQKGACDDIEEIVPAGPGTAGAITSAANKLNPKGKTPISDSVRFAAKQLKFTEDKATVILVTDGLETCNADPCAVASELEKAGVDFTAHVVGFGLTEEEGRKVACLAENTGGQYFPAKDASSLSDALRKTVAAVRDTPPQPAPAPKQLALENNVVLTALLAEGAPLTIGDAFWEFSPASGNPVVVYGNSIKTRLEPGQWKAKVTAGLVTSEFAFEAKADEAYDHSVILNAAVVDISVAADTQSPPANDAYVDIVAGGKQTSNYGPQKFIVPAGDAKVSGRIGEATVFETLALAAGETKVVKLVAGAGVLALKGVYGEGGPAVELDDAFWEILESKAGVDGSRKSLASTYGKTAQFSLPAGDYVALLRHSEAKVEAPAIIKVGERTEVTLVLNAGVLAIEAPGAYWIEVFDARKDLQGNRRSRGGVYGQKHQITVAPGDYVVEAVIGADLNGTRKSANASVKTAERTEIKVE
jgi:Ca-activated chloride channel family protein